MTKTIHALGALVLLIGVSACSGGDDKKDTDPSSPSTNAGTSESPRDEATSETEVVAYDLAEACKNFAANSVEGVDEAVLINNSFVAEEIVAAGDPEVQDMFAAIADTAGTAADTVGTANYDAAETAYESALSKANDACEQLGTPLLQD